MVDTFITPLVLPRRILNYTGTANCKLSDNRKHRFANQFAQRLFRSNAVCSVIPMNASSTLRFSIAIDNGVINHVGQINWIHENADAFSTDLHSLITTEYSFTILRCPYQRLLSCYLNKIAQLQSEAWILHHHSGRNIPANRVTFYDFLLMLEGKNLLHLDHHWRPQVDYLVYQKYDDYYCFERFDELKNSLKSKIDLDVIDTTDYMSNSIKGHTRHQIEAGYFLTPLDLQPILDKDMAPNAECMYNDEMIDIVYRLYGNDIDFYKLKFGGEYLLFD